MSFAYIDSQGKEVAIPGPDALRLRIELGAITDSTRFYDVSEDRWAAASEHEIYRQLKRDIESVQFGDFVPPSFVEPEVERAVDPEVEPAVDPDVEIEAGLRPDGDSEATADFGMPPDPDPEPEDGLDGTPDLSAASDAAASADVSSADSGQPLVDDFEWAAEPDPSDDPTEATDSAEPDPADDTVEATETPEAMETPEATETAEADESPDPYFGEELDADVLDQAMMDADSLVSPDDPEADELMWPEGATAEELDMGMDTFTLADPVAPSDSGGDASSDDDLGPESGSEDDSVSDDPGFDFGSAVLEDEEEDEVSDGPGFDFGSAVLEVEEDEADMELDEPEREDEVSAGIAMAAGDGDASPTDDAPDFGMVFEGGAPQDRFEEGGELEPDDSEMDETERGSSPDEGSSGSGEGADSTPHDPYDRTIPQRRGPRSRPPRRRGGSSGALRLAAGVVAVVAVVGAGAWFMSGSGDEAPAVEEVVLPSLSPELEPQLREFARNASIEMVAEFDSLPQRLALSEQPGAQWLTGPYLSTASSFEGVRQYWERFDALLDAMIASEDELWDAAWDEQLAAAQLPVEAEAQLRERGTMGWAAAAPDRRIVYEQLRGVIDASLDLHRFLVENESAITFDPSTGGGAGDPVLEVVPATPELGDEMWTGVGRITVALDAFGYIQQVETEPLLDAVKTKLVTIGVR